ncbi:hypothetical protein QJQ45_024384, partial [Haematococcus lacustris]
ASGSGQQDQEQGQAVKEVIAERRPVIKAALRGLVEAARPDLSPAQVDADVAEVDKRMTMGSKYSPRTAATPAQLPPPVQLNIWDPQLLAQISDAMELLTKASVLEHLMRGPHHRGIRLLPGEELDEVHLLGDGNSLDANATKIITSIQEFYRHPGRFITRWLDRDTNGCLNLQRIGESMQRPLELCSCNDKESLHPVGEEYQQRYKLVNDPRGIAEMREYVFDPDTQIGVGIDPGVTQAVSAASGVWDERSGQLVADQLAQWKLTKGQHLAAASSAGTSLEANLKHITVTLATWDAVWDVYLDPKWARQRLRLYGAQDRALEQFFKLEEEMAEVSMERHGRAKQLVVFFKAAGIGTRDWSQQRDQPVRGLMGCPVVASRQPPQAPCSSLEATPAAASEPGPSTPPPAKRSKRTKAEQAAEPTQPTKAAKAKPAPQPGRWLDRGCNAALNMQRIGESRWRPLELCYWPDQGALPAKGKECLGLGYKRLRDKPPKAQQQQPAEAHSIPEPTIIQVQLGQHLPLTCVLLRKVIYSTVYQACSAIHPQPAMNVRASAALCDTGTRAATFCGAVIATMDNVQRDLSLTSAKLQRLLSELDSTPRDHKDREWMQQRVLALQQKEAALQQEKAALEQKEAALQQQKAALQQKEAALVQKELHELQQRENKLYKGITLYTPWGQDGYLQRNLKLTTRKQLAAKLRANGDDTVAIVDSMPLKLLGPEYKYAQDVDEVELADGMQLAVVVNAERPPLGKLVERVSDVEDMATEHAGWQRGRISADETREWAVQHLIQTGHKGVRPFCYKKITLRQDGKTEGQIEIDGMAVSETAVVLVERKPIINMKYVNGLLFKLRNYEYIVDNNAPNTEQLVTTATVLSPRTRKPVQAVLMADGWVDNESERAACKQVMLQAGILPVLPCAASHAQGDICNSWPPQAEDLALAAQYSSTQPKQARGTLDEAMKAAMTNHKALVAAAGSGVHLASRRPVAVVHQVAKAQRGLQARFPGPPPGRPSATSFDGEGPPPARGYCYHCGLSSHWTKHCKRKASGLSKEAAMKDAGTWELMQDLKKGGSALSKAVKQDRSPDRGGSSSCYTKESGLGWIQANPPGKRLRKGLWWRPLELCHWPDQGALPAKGKECLGLGYKRLRDKPPKAQQQQQQPAEAQCYAPLC